CTDPANDGLVRADGLGLVSQLLERSREQVRSVIRAYASSVSDVEGLSESLTEQLELRLHVLVRRVVALEVNAARLRGQLTGETAPERFLAFVRRLNEGPFRDSINGEYPVLGRLASLTCANWVAACSDFCRNFADDYEVIRQLLGRSIGRCSRV